jgi:TatD DNase family protein
VSDAAGVELCDSHAHLDFEDYDGDREGVIARARAAGVTRVVAVGLWKRPGSFGNAHELAAAHPGYFFPTAGVHPHDCAQVPAEDWARLDALARDPATVAVGEIGLDYHYDHSPREDQRRWFRHQLALARDVGKPVIVHTREADADTAAILAEARPERGLIHCFTGDVPAVKAYRALDLYVSVAGIVTFRTAEELRRAVALVPLDRLLVETDCPFLAPVPFRGKRNEPAHVRLVAEAVARVHGVSFEEVARRTSENARRFFGLP